MNRIRLFAIAAMMMFALTVAAQQATTKADHPAGHSAKDAPGGVPTAESQLKLLTERLALTGDQQAKVKLILQELQDASLKFVQDESMSRAERMDNVKAGRYKADRQIRELLSDEQKKKLDQLEQEPHPELHGNM